MTPKHEHCDICKEPKYYTYYDTPEGCDIIKKLFVTTRYSLMTGIIIATHDVLMFSHPVGILKILARYRVHTVPLVLMSAAFTTVSNVLVNVRQENDKLNYVAGALASAPMLGYYLGTAHAWFLGSIFLSAIAILKKDSVDYNYRLFPPPRPAFTSLTKWRNDYTLHEDPRDVSRRNCVKHNPPKE